MAPAPDTLSTQDVHRCEDLKDYKYYIRFLCDAVALTTTSSYLDNSMLPILAKVLQDLSKYCLLSKGRISGQNDSRTKFGIL